MGLARAAGRGNAGGWPGLPASRPGLGQVIAPGMGKTSKPMPVGEVRASEA